MNSKIKKNSLPNVFVSLLSEKNDLNDVLSKIKADLSGAYDELRSVDGEKTNILLTLKSLEKDINEIDEKLKKDEGRKAKIQE